MTYFNPCFEISALAFLIVIMIFFFGKHKRYDLSDRVFGVFVVVAFLNISTDIISAYFLANARVYPLVVQYIINTLYMMTQYLSPSMFLMYINSIINPNKKRTEIILNIYMIPVTFGIISLAMNPFTHTYFYFDADMTYRYGNWHWLLYANALLYLLMGFIHMMINRKYITKVQMNALVTMIATISSSLIIQYYFPQYLLTGVGLALSLLMVYLTFQNPDIYLDQLMGVSNRTAMIGRIEEYIGRDEKFQSIIIALDSFKMVNDVFGIHNGDILLKNLADKICEITEKENVYRYNGDIVVILLPQDVQAEILCEQIRKLFDEAWNVEKLEITVTASVCLVFSNNHDDTVKSVISAIDYSVAEAKKMGHNSYYIENDSLLQNMQRRTAIEHVLTENINKGHIEVFYQPIYSVETGKFYTAEALARLKVPGYGYVPPDEFISIAEQSGQIAEIGMLVLEEVCKTLASTEISEYGIKYIEVNLSVAQCIQENFYAQVLAVIDKYKIPHNKLNFEVTETVAAYSERILTMNMSKLNKEGINFSLDDYGTGYSTVSYISKLPFNIVKIDKEIVQSSLKDKKAHIILSSSIDMLKKLDLEIIAEGAETSDQAQSLQDMKVDFIQGFYYAKPMPSDELLEFLYDRRDK